jgi:hypothetical protein
MCSSSITLSISCVSLVGMSRTFQGKLGLQFNGHTTGDGELILRHAGLGHYMDDGKLIYAGRVGTGMREAVIADRRGRVGGRAVAFARQTTNLVLRTRVHRLLAA